MKLIADTLGVVRSNLVEQIKNTDKDHGRSQHQGDDELLSAIRQLIDARPTTATGGSPPC